jgi:GH25 family lysozyme M1 (1,4-beta-N-acetylmuramidase)
VTVLGIDVSDNNAIDLNHVFDQGYDFVTARCVIGNYKDTRYPTFRDAAKARGKLFAAYVFPHTDVPWTTQATLTRQWIGDPSIPIMLDVEPDPAHGARPPTLADVAALAAALRAEGLRPVSFYGYDYFDRTLGAVASIGLPLVMANYGSNIRGYGSALYPGDTAAAWGPYPEGPVTILQFGSNGVIDGYAGPVDLDAYRGTLAQLTASGLFKDWSGGLTSTDVTTLEQHFDTKITALQTALTGAIADRAVLCVRFVNSGAGNNESAVYLVAGHYLVWLDPADFGWLNTPAIDQVDQRSPLWHFPIYPGTPDHRGKVTPDPLADMVAKAVAPVTSALTSAIADLDTRLTAILTAVETVQGPPGLPGPAGPAGPAGTPAVVDAAAVEAVLAGSHAEVTFAVPGSAS